MRGEGVPEGGWLPWAGDGAVDDCVRNRDLSPTLRLRADHWCSGLCFAAADAPLEFPINAQATIDKSGCPCDGSRHHSGCRCDSAASRSGCDPTLQSPAAAPAAGRPVTRVLRRSSGCSGEHRKKSFHFARLNSRRFRSALNGRRMIASLSPCRCLSKLCGALDFQAAVFGGAAVAQASGEHGGVPGPWKMRANPPRAAS